jgi:hypothetical protein
MARWPLALQFHDSGFYSPFLCRWTFLNRNAFKNSSTIMRLIKGPVELCRISICAVIVLYRERAEDSTTVRSLQQVLAQSAALASRLLVCVYDNSPEPAPLPPQLFPCSYVSFQPRQNMGLAVAYNTALGVAKECGSPWLLLLDSDTEVTNAYLQASLQACDADPHQQVAALVPHIVEGRLVHSPRFCRRWSRPALPLAASGVFQQELIAMNSGSIVRISVLNRIGGFHPDFWLDYLDYWLFRKLYKEGYRVYVLPERLEHSLSFADPVARMSLQRYRNMLQAEGYFIKKFGYRWEKLRLRFVLLKRAAKFAIQSRNREFLRLTVRQLFLPSAGPPNVS